MNRAKPTNTLAKNSEANEEKVDPGQETAPILQLPSGWGLGWPFTIQCTHKQPGAQILKPLQTTNG